MPLHQNEIINRTELLNEKGNVANPGWAKQSLYSYNRKKIKASALRIKEWDYYCVLASDYGVAITAADNGYMGFFAATVFDFKECTQISDTIMTILPLGKYKLPTSSGSGCLSVKEKGISLNFSIIENKRVLKVDYPLFNNSQGLKIDITLTPATYKDDIYDRMVIATPFNKSRHFYFNEKHNCLFASGTVEFNKKVLTFGKNKDDFAMGVLDWGRGVWTYKNTWFWSSLSTIVDGIPFGFNLGYGFGNTQTATENMLFFNGKAHKLDRVVFEIPKNDKGEELFTKPWQFESSDDRLSLRFEPILDRFDDTNVLIIRSNQHQVFGYFTGTAVLDDGKQIKIQKALGFAEKVYNRW